ncbi:hypothetical protein SNE26_18140 [Mucilaginibacter sp. cycad4]|uniref:hypothetical protein n=1 Tax=Mucilaginibacter sp. cycad4 TaxID=3342096 RepID=UPI002AAACB88|nr:hypothetical protein [Mucilaginibacter gossypii]WPU97949.1 hypothetical protein SNE26_18140 [Mucilaginibacter gossypii]
MKHNISTNSGSFKTHPTYSPEEVLAAGGTTAFSLKSNKNTERLIKALQNSPVIEPFTDEEWNDLTKQMDKDK